MGSIIIREHARNRTAYAQRVAAKPLSGLALTGCSLLAMAGAATPARADNSAQPTASQVSELVVTAEKREESINSVPMSITAATGLQLEAAGIRQPRDLVKITPSFNYADSYVGSPIYTLRGVGFSDISLGGRSTVAIYTDEAPVPFPIETRGVNLDLERVEVLKGPQGTLYGQNATGGAINYIAAKPTKTVEAGATLSYGNYNAVDASGFLSGPITSTLGARVAIDHTGMDAWQRSYTTGKTTGAQDFTTARLLLDWTPDDRFRAQLNVNGFIDHSEVQAGQAIAIVPEVAPLAPFVPGLLDYPVAPANPTAADFNPGDDYHRHNYFFQANLRLDYTLGRGLKLTSLTSYSQYSERQLQDIDGTTLSNINQLTFGHINSVSEELRVSADLEDRGHFLAGVNYAHDLVLETDYDAIPQSTLALVFHPNWKDFRDMDNQDENTYAVFASGDYSLTDQLKLYGGLRYTRSLNSFSGCTSDTGDGNSAAIFGPVLNSGRAALGLPLLPPIPPGGCITADDTFTPGLVRNNLNQNNLSWRVGAEWTPVPRMMFYANVSKGYKAGGFPDLGATAASQLSPATQESVLAYEAGFKLSLLDRTLQLNGAGFHYDYTDKQILGKVLDPYFGPSLRLINVPKSRLDGAELQLVWTPVAGLTLSTGGSYIDSRVLDHFTNYDATAALVDFNGEAFPNTPKWQFVSDIDYRRDITDKLRAFVGAAVQSQSSTYSELGELPLLKVDGYTLVDLRAGVETRDGVWRLTFWGRNVGNTYYWTTSNPDLDTWVRFAGMPRTFGLTLEYRQ
jgi:outer membrane receptor protein involved in Fe transport